MVGSSSRRSKNHRTTSRRTNHFKKSLSSRVTIVRTFELNNHKKPLPGRYTMDTNKYNYQKIDKNGIDKYISLLTSCIKFQAKKKKLN